MKRCPLIVGLIGLAGSGKSTVTKIITKNFKFELIHLGDHIRELLARNGLAQTPENERAMQMSIREERGMSALMNLSTPEIRAILSRGCDVLIDSMCSFSEKECLKLAAENCKVHIVAVHTPSEKRQLQLSGRSDRPLSFEQMNERDLLELDHLEKGKLLALADHHLVNNAAPEILEKEVGLLMDSIGAIRKT